MEEIGLDLTSNEYRLLGTLELRSLRNDEGVPSMILVPHGIKKYRLISPDTFVITFL